MGIGGLTRIGGGEPRLLAKIRSSLMLLADGGPFVRWFDSSADEGLELEEMPIEPQDLAREICGLVRARSQHLELVEDEFERFFARMAIHVQQRTGLSIPQLSDSRAI